MFIFLTVLGLQYCAPAFFSCRGRGYSLAGVHWFHTFSFVACLVGRAEGRKPQQSRNAELEGQAPQLRCRGFTARRHAESSRAKGLTHLLCTGRRILHHWTTREARDKVLKTRIHRRKSY